MLQSIMLFRGVFFFFKEKFEKYTLFIYTSIHLIAIIVLEKCSNEKKKGERFQKLGFLLNHSRMHSFAA